MLYVNGEFKGSNTGETFDSLNPATGESLGQVAKADADETRAAIDAAAKAFPAWSRRTAREREQILRKSANRLRSRMDELARLITMEMGKPVAEAKGELRLAIDYIEWYAEEGKRIYGDTIPAATPDKRLFVIRQPVGVVAAITPWNFPVAMITRKISPALAAGCTVVLKPASATPLTSIEICKAFQDAGLPAGVLNMVHGSASEIVGAMMKSPDVRKVTFTGSTEVGKELVRQSAETLKKCSMELGGHAPFLVFDDADLQAAAEGAIASKFRNAGQTCICTNRIYVQQGVADEFARIMGEKLQEQVVGNGLDEGVTIGPLINEAALLKVKDQLADALQKGARLVCGGKQLTDGEYQSGYFFEPTVLTQATHAMTIAHEETFGPLAPIFTFTSEAEAVQRANDTPYGLASYLYTNDVSRIFRVSEALEYGIIGVNDPIPTVAQAPFGGVKESGMGREGGKYGIEDYLEYKFVSLKIDDRLE